MDTPKVQIEYVPSPFEKFMMDSAQATFKEVASLNNKMTFIMVLIVLSIIAGLAQACGLVR
jgi:hypothetical protein